jgi:hypothetical protein
MEPTKENMCSNCELQPGVECVGCEGEFVDFTEVNEKILEVKKAFERGEITKEEYIRKVQVLKVVRKFQEA